MSTFTLLHLRLLQLRLFALPPVPASSQILAGAHEAHKSLNLLLIQVDVFNDQPTAKPRRLIQNKHAGLEVCVASAAERIDSFTLDRTRNKALTRPGVPLKKKKTCRAVVPFFMFLLSCLLSRRAPPLPRSRRSLFWVIHLG